MPEAGVISAYLDSLASALSFDRSLARCVREEVEDHLREAVASDRAADPLAAERRAVANFGDPHVIAAQFAVVSLAKQTRRVGVAVILVVAGVFVAMKARVAWYAATHWAMSADMRAVGAAVVSIDRYAFWLSVIIGIGSLAYIGGRPIPASFYPAYRRRLRRFAFLCAAATAALAVSVISDGVLTALQLLGAEPSAEFLVPIGSMAFEIACAGVLVFLLRRVTQRTETAAAVLKI